MSHIATQILALIQAHPEWAVVLVAFTSFGESFLLVSLLFPGTAILVAAGGLIAAGILEPLQVIAAGILGGILGDAASFWLGQKFGGALPKLWPFRGNPARIQGGIDFFGRYGTAGVFLSRSRTAPGNSAHGGGNDADAGRKLLSRQHSVRRGLGARARPVWRSSA
jgi:membrane protein DedA with SNARE-associated domain